MATGLIKSNRQVHQVLYSLFKNKGYNTINVGGGKDKFFLRIFFPLFCLSFFQTIKDKGGNNLFLELDVDHTFVNSILQDNISLVNSVSGKT